MSRPDPNVAMVERVAEALGALREQVVLVGGCAAGLLLTDPAATPPRKTLDVDLVVEVAALANYHQMEERLAQRGFKRDVAADAPICRWRHGDIEVDLMPTDGGILGFANRWYPLAVELAQKVVLTGSGTEIRLITAPLFLATKFEAFADRGKGDLLASHDLEDIISIIDGRPELLTEVLEAPEQLRTYLAAKCRELISTPHFRDYLPGLVAQDESRAERAAFVDSQLRALAALNRV